MRGFTVIRKVDTPVLSLIIIFGNSSDGKDHTQCCRSKAVTGHCLPLCEGIVPGDVLVDGDKLEQCALESTAIFGCTEMGHSEFVCEYVCLL